MGSDEGSQIDELVRAAREVAARRRFLRDAALASAWAAPIIESLTVVPEAEAQGHGHMGSAPIGHGHHHP